MHQFSKCGASLGWKKLKSFYIYRLNFKVCIIRSNYLTTLQQNNTWTYFNISTQDVGSVNKLQISTDDCENDSEKENRIKRDSTIELTETEMDGNGTSKHLNIDQEELKTGKTWNGWNSEQDS